MGREGCHDVHAGPSLTRGKTLSTLRAPAQPYPHSIAAMQSHLGPAQAISLMRDGGRFTPGEVEHLKYCESCHEWIAAFADLGRKAGLKYRLELPYKLRRRISER